MSDNHGVYLACRFYVMLEGVAEAVFTEVSGLQIETEVFSIEEGGNNSFVKRLPGRTKHTNLVLKRGLLPKDSSKLLKWYEKVIKGEPFERETITVLMYDSYGDQVLSWAFRNAFPVKWVGPQLNAGSDEVAIETLEFAFDDVEVS